MIGWLRAPLQTGGRNGFRVIASTGVVALLGVLLALPMGSDLQARTAACSIGLIAILAAQLRPPSLWEAGSTQTWRHVLGDRLTVWTTSAAGALICIGAWLLRLS